MKPFHSLLSLALLSCPAIAAEAADSETPPAKSKDMLRFANNDTLHGEFLSFSKNGSLIWINPQAERPIHFSTKDLHRVVLNQGLAGKSTGRKSTVRLVNGDVIPCEITSVSQKSVNINTPLLGAMSIPRNTVAAISPNPMGSKLLYYGPVNSKGWNVITPAINDQDKAAHDAKNDATENKRPESWKYINHAWYAGTNRDSYLVRENALPDTCRVTFKLAWRNSLYANIILHADFAPPEFKGKKEGKFQASTGKSYRSGRAYILNLSNHSASLSSTTFDEDGKPKRNSHSHARSSLSLSGKSETAVELRIDRVKKSILLYTDGSYRCKWDLGENYHGKGDHLAFQNLGYNHAQLKLSDVSISHWNGMKDSAQSMTHPKRDVILLGNGVDRFSGTFNEISNDQISFRGTFDNDMSIPLADVQELHLSTGSLSERPETDPKAVHFHIYPEGRITGIPLGSENGKTKLLTSLLGEVSLDTRYINIIDFSETNSILDLWDDNF